MAEEATRVMDGYGPEDFTIRNHKAMCSSQDKGTT